MAMLTGVGISGLAGMGYTINKIYQQYIGLCKVKKKFQKNPEITMKMCGSVQV